MLFNFILTGQVSPNDDYGVYYCERMPWCKKILIFNIISHYTFTKITHLLSIGIHITFRGNTGHGSRFIEKTAAEKLVCLLKVIKYKDIKLNDSMSIVFSNGL